ncbi:UvrD-helicase domain-containing protein [Nocardia camponoti]|uniref:DNA 3'-5' helicase n=1 Tax=Nocardia camponoti TaxID=1616106 RepID=A0A917QTC7_9NOCA|nr:UvrD-helicase domain-containing protein [Nocardia camponoti]GGK67577.1 DNA helicase [Nocardia camponoti]
MKAEVRMHDLFTSSYDQLDGSIRSRVLSFIMKLSQDPEAPGLDYKIPKLAQHKLVRTARVTDNYRAVLIAAGADGDTSILYLVAVKKHDDAYDYASKLTLQVNPKTGAAELFDSAALGEVVEKARSVRPSAAAAPPLMPTGIKQKDLERFGVAPDIAEQLRQVTDEDTLEAIVSALPSSQGNAVLDLVYGKSPDQVWSDLVIEDPGEVDVDDIAAALHRPLSRLSFTAYEGENEDELRAVLEGDLAAWRVWLHPLQRKLAQHTGWNGPFRVTGGAGTGKTVTAIHRARHLARHLDTASTNKVLFTTFTKNLSRTIESQLKQLAGPKISERVDVVNIDALARRVVAATDAGRKALGDVRFVSAEGEEVRELWASAAMVGLGDWSPTFLADEWSRVVLGNAIVDEAAYLRVTRSGRAQRLTRPQRADVWQVIEQFERLMRSAGLMTFIQLAARAAATVATEPALRDQMGYRHAVVDEAQDLHPAHWKLLRSLIASGMDDLFIVGDAHQRIYGKPTPLSRYGIETRGRSRRLTVNYRTSKQILHWCLSAVDAEVDDLDLSADTLAGARSVFKGPEPEPHACDSAAGEDKALIAQINAWITDGLALSDIAVFAYDRKAVQSVADALADRGIASAVVTEQTDEDKLGNAVRVMTMHRAKGLEFRAVALVRLGADSFPPYYVQKMTGPERKLEEHKLRNVLYVAGSRARERLALIWTKKLSSLVAPPR